MATKATKHSMGRGKWPTGVVPHGNRFRYWVMHEGVRRYVGPYDTPLEAAAAREKFVEIAPSRKRKRLTLDGAFQRVRDRWPSKATSDAHQGFSEEKFKALTTIFDPDISLRAITPDKIRDYMQKRMRKVSKESVHKEVAILRRIFNVCMQDGVIDASPMPQVEMPRIDTAPMRWVSKDEFLEGYGRMIDWRPSQYRTDYGTTLDLDRLIPLLMFSTGARRSEIARFRVRDFDAKKRTLAIDGKCGSRAVPVEIDRLLPALTTYIERHHLGPDDALVESPEAITELFRRWKKRLGLDWTAHQLRHGFGTTLHNLNIPQKRIMTLMGHETPHMTLRYQHETDDGLRDAIDGLFD